MSKAIAEDLAKSLRQVAKGWKTEKRHADRNDRVPYHSLVRMRIGSVRPIIREIAFEVMDRRTTTRAVAANIMQTRDRSCTRRGR